MPKTPSPLLAPWYPSMPSVACRLYLKFGISCSCFVKFEVRLSCSCFVKLNVIVQFSLEILPWVRYRRCGKTTARLFTFRLVEMILPSVRVLFFGLVTYSLFSTLYVCSPNTPANVFTVGVSSASESVTTKPKVISPVGANEARGESNEA
jgi:hypothetical protein